MDAETIPVWMQCPILQTVMTDPVIAFDGHTYERSAIQQWLSIRCTSPITNLQLQDSTLVPNMALRSAIDQWLATHPQHRPFETANTQKHEQPLPSNLASTGIITETQTNLAAQSPGLQLIQAISEVTRDTLVSLDMTVTGSIRPDKACHFYEPHYRLMRWLGSKLPSGTRVWDLGSHDSLVPTALANNGGLMVDVYNVEWFGGVAVHNNIRWHHLNGVPWGHVNDVQLIVVELHPHNGIYHRTVLQKLYDARWRGILCIGAVDLNNEMASLWQEVQSSFTHAIVRFRCGYVFLDGMHQIAPVDLL